MSTKLPTISVLLMSMLCSACEQWPPSETELRQHFEQSRQSFNRLAEKIRRSDFRHVSRGFNSRIEATPVTGGSSHSYIVDDDPEWSDLLDEVRMYGVYRNEDDVVSFDASAHFPVSENQDGTIAYIRNPELGSTAQRCQPEHEKIPCGYCIVPLGEDWYISYYWVQSVFDQDQYDAYINGNISLNDYQRSRETAVQQCEIDGAQEMSYPGNGPAGRTEVQSE